MRRILCVMAAVVLVAACGGGDDGDEDAVALDLEPIAAVEACDLLDEGTAADLAGGEVRKLSADDDPNVCEFGFADESVGSGIAASLRLGEGDESDVPGGSLAQTLQLGDAGAVETTDTAVKVVYVVRTVVVRIEVAPASGEVDDALVERVVEFAETTEEPVVEAVTGEAPATTDAPTTTAEPPSTTTTEAASSTTVDTTIADLWSRNAIEFRDRVGEEFDYECPGPGLASSSVWGTGTYTDDSSVCSAAVHSGVITVEEGGDVTIVMTGPQDFWPASEANGITTSEWPEWPGGFDVLGD